MFFSCIVQILTTNQIPVFYNSNCTHRSYGRIKFCLWGELTENSETSQARFFIRRYNAIDVRIACTEFRKYRVLKISRILMIEYINYQSFPGCIFGTNALLRDENQDWLLV